MRGRSGFQTRMIRGLFMVVAACAWAAASAQPSQSRTYWSGQDGLADDSLFAEFRAYQESRRFVSEPILAGETLVGLLERLAIDPDDAEAAAQAFFAHAGITTLDPGTQVRIKYARAGMTVFQIAAGGVPRPLAATEILAAPDRLVSVVASDNGFRAFSREVELETRYVAAAGEIRRALSVAALDAGVPRELMIEFANVFAFDVDFAREIFRGDRFEVVFEMRFDQQGRPIEPGEIVFAGLTWKGGSARKGYYRFLADGADEAGYYSADGRNPRTLLMKSPINGARVTSRFGRRRHPVLGYAAGHKGIDFGAPSGTPIMAAGDGVIEIAGPRGTYGNYIRIDHDDGYETAYAHLRGFAPGIEPGKTVRQGEVIGYVGTTGRSTGPHLHYEVLADGEHLNPETVSVAVGDRLAGEGLAAFSDHREFIDSLRIQPFAVVEATLP